MAITPSQNKIDNILKKSEKWQGEDVFVRVLNEKKNIQNYKNVESNIQIRTIVQTGTIRDYYSLGLLLSKFIYSKDSKNIHKKINKILDLSKYLTDDKIFKFLKEHLHMRNREVYFKTKKSRDHIHAQLYYEHINDDIFKKYPDYKITKYLDVSCGNCIKTKILGDMLGLKSDQIFGNDIEKWYAYTDETRVTSDIVFSHYNKDGTMAYNNNEFDLISAFMVLHHVENLDLILKEICRCLKPGGFFIIREHDAHTAIDYMLIDIEHQIYDYDLFKNKPNSDHRKIYYGKYYNWLEWDIILDSYGLKYVNANYDSAHAIFNISPTRYYYSIYQKI